jgi:dihydroflavonol-4-reductase
MARAVVLGATGHIGAHIVRALLAGGHEVRAAYRNPCYLDVLDGLPVERVQVDLESGEGLARGLRGREWVFHAAGYYPRSSDRRERAVERAVLVTRRVLGAIRQAGSGRVVFTSSASTIRRLPGRLATEQDEEPWPLTEPRPLYATVKIAMEHEARRAIAEGLSAVIVNPSVCIGEYDAHRFSGRAILHFAKTRIPFTLDHMLNAVYTGDVGVGHVRAAGQGRVGERYLLAAHNVALPVFAAVVARAAGVPIPRWQLPRRIALAAAAASEGLAWLTRTEPILPRSAVHAARTGPGLDASKARRELALPQTPLEDAVARAVAWFRAHGDL